MERFIDIFGDNYNKIKSYFEKLNVDSSHFNNSNDICTPIDCVKEMVDSIPLNFWNNNNLKILDSCAGNGNFHAYIATKTKLSNLYFNEINTKRVENLKNYFGDKINLSLIDFLKFEDKEEYDLVVSNPPYAKFNNGKRTSKNHNLSRDFIRKALNITKYGGYILFLVPNNWMSYSDRNVLPKELSKYQFIEIDIHGPKKYFPKVGSSFTWFLLRKIENEGKETIIHNNYFINDIQKVKIQKESNFIPLYYSKEVLSIINKTINSKLPKYNVETTSFLHKYTKMHFISDIKSEEFKYKLIHTPSQTVWSKIKHKFHDGYKVFLPLTNQFFPFVDNDCGMTQSIAFIRCANQKEAKKVENELKSDLYKFLVNITRYGNFNNVRVLQSLPVLKNVVLNQKEIKLIQEFNTIYYNGKKEKQKYNTNNI